MLKLPTNCQYCTAKNFSHESKTFCCSDGKVILTSNVIPPAVYELYTSSSFTATEFQKYIRPYNNTFSFTSLGEKFDKELCKNK